MDIEKELAEQKELLGNIYRSVEKTRKYFMWTLIVTVVVFVLPLIGLVFVIPFFLKSFSALYKGF